jgi:hypothetical protein
VPFPARHGTDANLSHFEADEYELAKQYPTLGS